MLNEKDRERVEVSLPGWYQASRFLTEEMGCLGDDSYKDVDQQERLEWLESNLVGRVLDIGCGLGTLLHSYSGPGVGIDKRLYYVAKAQLDNQNDGHEFYCVDVLGGLPFDDESFDVVVLAEVLEHMTFSNAVYVLKEALRCGNAVVLTLPYMRKEGYNLGDVESGEHRWSPTLDMVKWLVEEAGGEMIEMEEVADGRFLGIQLERKMEKADE